MDIYQHFRKEEQPFIDQVLSWREDVALKYQRKLTDFLDPREQMILKAIMGSDADLIYGLQGGADASERKRAILAPEYERIEKDDYQLTLLEASYPQKFVNLEHRDVLGAFMSLGIRREKIGDLIVQDGIIQMIAASEISDYIKMNLTGIKRSNVQFEEKPLSLKMESKETWSTRETTVSSLRLDVMVKEIYGMSRNKASMFIEGGHVKVNFRTVEDPSFSLEEGDLISLRGKGRSRLDEIFGQTKKDKYKVMTAKLN
ncbi:RNA-binding protein YlmH, contains S4-like domain [Halobacillus karajensis]|uniref:YlmH family RNA-binding protein n=1 Tax=Halobacillus karajensis TaxID=195088 RepID=UPI0008A7402B|nr:RNA-binding protein [Halobacillus karajensis]SEH71535.1 RNA-binding protein YlmH, contains S4-like domain [Halobacillus karajensis]